MLDQELLTECLGHIAELDVYLFRRETEIKIKHLIVMCFLTLHLRIWSQEGIDNSLKTTKSLMTYQVNAYTLRKIIKTLLAHSLSPKQSLIPFRWAYPIHVRLNLGDNALLWVSKKAFTLPARQLLRKVENRRTMSDLVTFWKITVAEKKKNNKEKRVPVLFVLHLNRIITIPGLVKSFHCLDSLTRI